MIYIAPESGSLARPRIPNTTFNRFVQMSNPDSPQLQVAYEFERGFRERNIDLLAKHTHRNFRRLIHPRSLSRPELGREEWLKAVEKILNFTTHLEASCDMQATTRKTPFFRLSPLHRRPSTPSLKLPAKSSFTSVSQHTRSTPHDFCSL